MSRIKTLPVKPIPRALQRRECQRGRTGSFLFCASPALVRWGLAKQKLTSAGSTLGILYTFGGRESCVHHTTLKNQKTFRSPIVFPVSFNLILHCCSKILYNPCRTTNHKDGCLRPVGPTEVPSAHCSLTCTGLGACWGTRRARRIRR